MSATVATVIVPTTERMQQAVMSYIAQGFVVSSHGDFRLKRDVVSRGAKAVSASPWA